MALFGRKKNAEATSAPQPTTVAARPLPVEPPAPGPDGRRSVAAHRDHVLSLVEPLPAFGMKMLDAVGLRLYEDLESYQDIPALDLALVEGYAVRASDVDGATPATPRTVVLAGRIRVGEVATGEVVAGECVHVAAGVPMPRGTDAVVPLDHGRVVGDDVAITLAVQPGHDVRARGGDIADGETLLRKGDRLDARTVGMLAGAGIDRVMARPRPRVVVVSTGAELIDPGQRLARDVDTYDANSYLLAAAARDLGAEVFRVGVYDDDPDAVREAIADQLIRADLIVTTGGISATDTLLRGVIEQMGASDFCDLALAGAVPTGFALVGADEVPTMLLPGDPISAYVAFQLFARPVIRKLMGIEPWIEPTVPARLASGITSGAGDVTCLRGRLSGKGDERVVEPFVAHASHQLGDLAQANALIMVPEDASLLEAGSIVGVFCLDPE